MLGGGGEGYRLSGKRGPNEMMSINIVKCPIPGRLSGESQECWETVQAVR